MNCFTPNFGAVSEINAAGVNDLLSILPFSTLTVVKGCFHEQYHTHSQADGMSTDTIGLFVCFRVSIGASNGARGSPFSTRSAVTHCYNTLHTLKENPKIASKMTSFDATPLSNSSGVILGTLKCFNCVSSC